MEYKYIGKIEVYLPGFGVIKPNQIIETNKAIDNPNFKIYKTRKRK